MKNLKESEKKEEKAEMPPDELFLSEKEKEDFLKLPSEKDKPEKERKKRKIQTPVINVLDNNIQDKIKEKIKKPPVNLEISKELQVKPEEFNAIVYAGVTTISYVIQKENLKEEDTKLFSTQLYNICKINGWLEITSFMPYILLAGATIDLGIKIASQPDKAGKHKVVTAGIQKSGAVQIVNDDELALKIAGNDRSLTAEQRREKLNMLGGIHDKQ